MSAALRVSVVLPVLDGIRFLAEALASVARQTLPAHEILVVDTGSRDGSPELAAATPGVRLLAHPGVPLARAYNLGVAAARGDLVAFHADDDLWDPRKLALHVARHAAEPELDYTVAHAEFFLAEGESCPPVMRRLLAGGPVLARVPESLVARRDAFARLGPFDERHGPSSDLGWFARGEALGARWAALDEVLLRKRVRGGSITVQRFAEGQRGLLTALRDSIEMRRRAR